MPTSILLQTVLDESSLIECVVYTVYVLRTDKDTLYVGQTGGLGGSVKKA